MPDAPVEWETCTHDPDCIGAAIPSANGRCLGHLEADEQQAGRSTGVE